MLPKSIHLHKKSRVLSGLHLFHVLFVLAPGCQLFSKMQVILDYLSLTSLFQGNFIPHETASWQGMKLKNSHIYLNESQKSFAEAVEENMKSFMFLSGLVIQKQI